MSLALSLLCFTSLLSFTSSKPLNRALNPRQETPLPPCGDVIAWVKNDYTYFDANYVYTCLRSVPFHPDVASRFLQYYSTTLQFHAPLDSLKAPPSGYQQLSFDVELGLAAIQSKIDGGNYTNQYQFEADVHRLTTRMHDPHVQLNAGILAAFSFASPYGIISASVDGKELPGVYINRDVVYSQREGWNPSPIVKINGEDPIVFLTRYAEANDASYLEPHAEWNSLMDSPVLDILGLWSAYQQGSIYPGDEDSAPLNIELKNGSKINNTWSAVYQEPSDTGPVTTADDFYNYFVLGLYPASWDSTEQWWPTRNISSNGTESQGSDAANFVTAICSGGVTNGLDQDQPSDWCQSSSAAFPNDPVVKQGILDISDDEIVTGYILDDISAGVLSIPRFYSTAAGSHDSFRTAIRDFIQAAQMKKVNHIIIDLQQNNGGSSFQAYDTFKLFFPDDEPYGASRTRKHQLADVLGKAYSTAFDNPTAGLDSHYGASEWVVSNRIDADLNTTFKSWEEYFANRGGYSLPQRYNLSDVDFDFAAFLAIPWGYDSETEDELTPQPFDADDIVILTDGLCSSSCAQFVEFMSHQGGVRTIAVGGSPKTGPMQAVSGSRGAAAYSADAIDYDITNVNDTLHDNVAVASLPNRSDTGMWINYAGITIRNQVRENDPTPLQFKYQAADCRIFYTLKNVYNMPQLWRDVAKATWVDTSLCVEGSTGFPSARNIDSKRKPPAPTKQAHNTTFAVNPDLFHSQSSVFEIQDGSEQVSRSQIPFSLCPKVGDTKEHRHYKCKYMDVTCASPKDKTVFTLAVPVMRKSCQWSGKNGLGDPGCERTATCTRSTRRSTKAIDGRDTTGHAPLWNGYCKDKSVAKQAWCDKEVHANQSIAEHAPPTTFKCKPITTDKYVPEVKCQQRMRIYENQTFAVWEKQGTSAQTGLDFGTCSAYTCKAPPKKELVKKTGWTTFLWRRTAEP